MLVDVVVKSHLEVVFAPFGKTRLISVAQHILVAVNLRNNLAIADQRMVRQDIHAGHTAQIDDRLLTLGLLGADSFFIHAVLISVRAVGSHRHIRIHALDLSGPRGEAGARLALRRAGFLLLAGTAVVATQARVLLRGQNGVLVSDTPHNDKSVTEVLVALTRPGMHTVTRDA